MASRASGGDNLMRWNEAMTDKNADPNECTWKYESTIVTCESKKKYQNSDENSKLIVCDATTKYAMLMKKSNKNIWCHAEERSGRKKKSAMRTTLSPVRPCIGGRINWRTAHRRSCVKVHARRACIGKWRRWYNATTVLPQRWEL